MTKINVVRDKFGKFASSKDMPVKVVDGTEFLNKPTNKPRHRRPSAAAGVPPTSNPAQTLPAAANPPSSLGKGIHDGSTATLWPSLDNYAPSK